MTRVFLGHERGPFDWPIRSRAGGTIILARLQLLGVGRRSWTWEVQTSHQVNIVFAHELPSSPPPPPP